MTCGEGHRPQQPDWYRPPMATPGNTAALVHGAYSPAVIGEQAKVFHAVILEDAPWCAEDQYRLAVDLASEMLAAAHLAFAALRDGKAKATPRLIESATSAARA